MALTLRTSPHSHGTQHSYQNNGFWRRADVRLFRGILAMVMVLISFISLHQSLKGGDNNASMRHSRRIHSPSGVASIRKTIHLEVPRPTTNEGDQERVVPPLVQELQLDQPLQETYSFMKEQPEKKKRGQKEDLQEDEQEGEGERGEEEVDDDDSTEEAETRRQQRRRRERPPGCLTSRCIKELAHSLALPYEERTEKAEWCRSKTDQENNDNSTAGNGKFEQGLLLVKVPKSASSTMAGVTLRIANRNGCDQVQWQHRPGTAYANRDPKRSFLLTSVRNPMTRVLSYVFFMDLSIEGKNGGQATDDYMLERLRNFQGRYGSIRDGQGGFTMQFASLDDIPKYSAWSPDNRTIVQNPQDVIARVAQMLDDYDFIVVVERMDESLVALSLLLGIDVADVLVTSSKVAGGNQYFWDAPAQRCVNLTKSFASPAVREYFNSDDWKAQNYGDSLLHAAASAALDKTIMELGNKRFQTALAKFRRLQQMEQQVCSPHVQFPCSNNGEPQPRIARKQCYQRDFGCGYPCIDDMVAKGIGFAFKQAPGPNGTTIRITTYGRKSKARLVNQRWTEYLG